MIGSIGQSLEISRTLFRTSTIFTSHMFGHLVVRMSRKHSYMYAYALMGTIDRRGYGGQQKGTICDARGPYPSI